METSKGRSEYNGGIINPPVSFRYSTSDRLNAFFSNFEHNKSSFNYSQLVAEAKKQGYSKEIVDRFVDLIQNDPCGTTLYFALRYQYTDSSPQGRAFFESIMQGVDFSKKTKSGKTACDELLKLIALDSYQFFTDEMLNNLKINLDNSGVLISGSLKQVLAKNIEMGKLFHQDFLQKMLTPPEK